MRKLYLRALQLKWYQCAWLAIQVTGSLFFIGYFGWLAYLYSFRNDGYHDLNSYVPDTRTLLAAGFVWAKTAWAIRTRLFSKESVENEAQQSQKLMLALIVFVVILTAVILLRKYSSHFPH